MTGPRLPLGTRKVPTPRQLQLLQLRADGLSLKDAARKLGMSYNTARTHMCNVIYLYGVSGMEQAVLFAIRARHISFADRPAVLRCHACGQPLPDSQADAEEVQA